MTSDWITSKKDAARFFGVSTQALDGWFNRGCPVLERDDSDRIKALSLPDMVAWRIGKSDDDGEGTLEQERTRLTKAQADKTELEVEVLRSRLIPSNQVEEVWGKMLGAFRSRCLGIPTKAATAVLSMTDVHEIELILKDHVHEALGELSEYDASQYGGVTVNQGGAASRPSTGDDSQSVG